MRILCKGESKVAFSNDYAHHSDVSTDDVSAVVAIEADDDYVQCNQKLTAR